jgi:hypothetical protein
MVENGGNASSRGSKKISTRLRRLAASFEGQARSGVALTPAQREAIKASPLSYRKLADLLHVNVKTVARWKRSRSPYGLRRGPKGGQSKSLTEGDEEMIAHYYAYSGKSIDKCLNDLKKKFPSLTRSTYWRCISRVRLLEGKEFEKLGIMGAVFRLTEEGISPEPRIGS